MYLLHRRGHSPGPSTARLQGAAHGLWFRARKRRRRELDIVPLKWMEYGFWVYYTKIPIYPVFYLLKGDYMFWVEHLIKRIKYSVTGLGGRM